MAWQLHGRRNVLSKCRDLLFCHLGQNSGRNLLQEMIPHQLRTTLSQEGRLNTAKGRIPEQLSKPMEDQHGSSFETTLSRCILNGILLLDSQVTGCRIGLVCRRDTEPGSHAKGTSTSRCKACHLSQGT